MLTKRVCIVTLTFLLPSLLACQPAQKSETEQNKAPEKTSAAVPYRLTEPDKRYALPTTLSEISGLTYYQADQVACVQDEEGIVYIYDLKEDKVVDEFAFGKDGDFEGIEWVNGTFYVLRSDGELYQFKPQKGNVQAEHAEVELPGKNELEGLGYDPKRKVLLLSVKDSKQAGSDKPIYYYDLTSKAVTPGPVFKQNALDNSQNNMRSDEVKPSGIAVHPQTGDYYVLASQGRRLVVLSPEGEVRAAVPLNARLFPQPESICFSPDGTLFIGNEDDLMGGTLLQFKLTQQ